VKREHRRKKQWLAPSRVGCFYIIPCCVNHWERYFMVSGMDVELIVRNSTNARNLCPAPESNEDLPVHLIFSKCAPYTAGPDFLTDKVGRVPMNEQKFNGAKRNLYCCKCMSRPRVERGPSAYIRVFSIHCWCTVHSRTLSTARASPVYLQDLNRLLVYSTF
jgi:hypothetical protein